MESAAPAAADPIPPPTTSSNSSLFLQETLLSSPVLHYENIKSTASNLASDLHNILQEHTGLDISTSEIANHYLDGLKYGLAGTTGTCLGNYCQYYQNNHDLLAICCANPLNPYNKLNRFLSFWSKTCLAFLLFSIFVYFRLQSLYEFMIVLCVTSPYGYFIDSMATCSIFYRSNYFVKCFHSLGFSILLLTSVLNVISLALGIAILILTKPNFSHFITQFLLSIVFDQLKPLYLGIFNWILHSWKGCLCLPQVSCCGSTPCPPRICPLLGFFPIKLLLNFYNLGKKNIPFHAYPLSPCCTHVMFSLMAGESTYHEDKEEFQAKYPNRIAIDKFKPDAQRESSMSHSVAQAVSSERVDQKQV